ncbi:hypothetical protein TSUD_250650 [Trifolium subterraneum]|nr:hypothetical protein TSUD_250650 [Trifolium subterraneum]
MAHPNLDGLSLHEEEEEGFSFDFDEGGDEQVDLRWCLVGRFLCEKAIHFNSMKLRMAELWTPVKGVTINETPSGKFLFHFAHPLDMEAVLKGGPWIFDNNTLLLEQVPLGMQVENIPLLHVNLWVQIHDLPTGLMKENVGIKLANYIGEFVEYDKNNNSSFWRQYMRIRVKVDIRQPLKKDTKVKNRVGEWCMVKFKYEKLGIFCFVCGIMGHAENKCEVRYSMEQDDGIRGWSAEIRADPRRQGGRPVSRWLREEKGGRVEKHGGDQAAQPTFTGGVRVWVPQSWQPGLPGPMKILSWNCRGLSTPSAIPNLRNIAQSHKPDILFLSETLSKAQAMERVRVDLKFNSCLSVDVEGRSGGLSVMWRDTINCRVMNYSRNFINLIVEEKEQEEWRLTCYYGYPERGRRKQAWDLLRQLRDMSDLPWCIVGDFNDLLSQEDKKGTNPHPNWLCNGFRSAVSDCDLTDIHLEGYPYTWIKSAGTTNVIEERLDRAMANSKWLMNYPSVKLLNLLASHSDHSPILLQNSPMIRNGKTYAFRFENTWLKEYDIEEVVEDGWGRGSNIEVTNKTTRCAEKLKEWGRRKRMRFKQEVMECSEEMDRLRGSHERARSQRYKEVQERHARLLIQEETYWRQRAKMHWLKEGDLNTKIFHMSASTRQRAKKIDKLVNEDNIEVKTQPEICQVAKNYFEKLFSASVTVHEPILSLIAPKVTVEDNEMLTATITKEELKAALFQMQPDKSPGPDGFNPAFYQHFWDLCGDDIYVATKEWLERGLKGCLDRYVSEEQSAFVEGRSILDNALIAIEIIHALKRRTKGTKGELALKIDISKAYDKVDWGFLRVGPIFPGRGLRQGDPLSPYLFILVTEGLTALLKNSVARGDIHGIQICRGAPTVSHLLFADDCFLFCRSTLAETNHLMSILKIYEEASGQEINLTKSEVFFSKNLSTTAQEDLSRIMGVRHVLGTGVYLGLPSMIGRKKKEVFAYLKDRTWKWINSWRGRALSKAGKEVMIKSVLQAIPSYVMSVYLLPESTIKDIERMLNSYWWGGGANNKGIRWLAWDRMSYPKALGGMGFRDLHTFNLAMIAKQGWNIMTKPHTLVAKLYKARYFPNSSLFESQIGHNPSYAWRGIWKARHVLMNGSRWSVGNGSNIKVMSEPWLRERGEAWIPSPQVQGAYNITVNDLMNTNVRTWNREKIESLFPLNIANRIIDIPLFDMVEEDKLVWADGLHGNYSVKSGYNLMLNITGKVDGTALQRDWKNLWRIHTPPKAKHLLWRICKGCLPTRTRLQHRHVFCQLSCPLCDNSNEDDWHILFDCNDSIHARQAAGLEHIILPRLQRYNNVAEVIHDICTTENDQVAGVFAMLLWVLWNNRNNSVWNDSKEPGRNLGFKARMQWEEWFTVNKFQQQHIIDEQVQQVQTWQKPPVGWYKCNVDAGFHKELNKTSFGWCLRDHLGGFVLAGTMWKEGNYSIVEGESAALLNALQEVERRGFVNVLFETDSKGVVNAIQHLQGGLSEFSSMICHIKNVLQFQQNFVVSFIKRQANMVAHTLSRAAISWSSRCTFEIVPLCITTLLNNEMN